MRQKLWRAISVGLSYELFDLQQDLDDQNNLSGNPELAEHQQDLLAELEAWMKKQGDKRTVFHEPLMLNASETWVPRRK